MIGLGLCLKEFYRACPQAAQSFDQSTRWQLVGGRNLNGSCCIRAKKDSWNDEEECPWLKNVVIKWNPPQVSEESERVSIRVSNWSDTFLMPGHALIFRACYVNMGIRGCHIYVHLCRIQFVVKSMGNSHTHLPTLRGWHELLDRLPRRRRRSSRPPPRWCCSTSWHSPANKV